MAIIDLQRRISEVGRIRIGQQVPIGKSGKTRPEKLETFRLTSPDLERIRHAARLYGGEVKPWKAPAGNQFEVITNTTTLPVLVPPADMAFTQFYELWSRGGCQRRCDGVTDSISDGPCLCDPDKRECDIHTRLSVLLRDMPGLGVWRIDTQGFYAAVELGGAVDLLKMATERGHIVPATLRLEQRAITREGQTRRFAVPVLDLAVSAGELLRGDVGVRLELPGEPAPAPTPADDTEYVDIGPGGVVLAQPTEADDGLTNYALAGIEAPPQPAAPITPVPAKPKPSIAEQIAVANQPSTRVRRGAEPVKPTGIAPRTAAQMAKLPTTPPATTTPAPSAAQGASPPDAGEEPAAPGVWMVETTTDNGAPSGAIPADSDQGQLLMAGYLDDPRAPGPNQLALGTETLPKLLSPPQLKKIMALLAYTGFKDHDTRVGFLSACLERTITTTNELTFDEASKVIDILEHDGPAPEPPDNGDGNGDAP